MLAPHDPLSADVAPWRTHGLVGGLAHGVLTSAVVVGLMAFSLRLPFHGIPYAQVLTAPPFIGMFLGAGMGHAAASWPGVPRALVGACAGALAAWLCLGTLLLTSDGAVHAPAIWVLIGVGGAAGVAPPWWVYGRVVDRGRSGLWILLTAPLWALGCGTVTIIAVILYWLVWVEAFR